MHFGGSCVLFWATQCGSIRLNISRQTTRNDETSIENGGLLSHHGNVSV